jgi:hypothetical protein
VGITNKIYYTFRTWMIEKGKAPRVVFNLDHTIGPAQHGTLTLLRGGASL